MMTFYYFSSVGSPPDAQEWAVIAEYSKETPKDHVRQQDIYEHPLVCGAWGCVKFSRFFLAFQDIFPQFQEEKCLIYLSFEGNNSYLFKKCPRSCSWGDWKIPDDVFWGKGGREVKYGTE